MADRRERQETGGFAERFREVVTAYGSASALAKAIQRSEGAIRKWLRGESEPNVTDLRAICENTRTNLTWLVTGQGSRQAPGEPVEENPPGYENRAGPSVDYGLLEKVIASVEQELRQEGSGVAPEKRAMLIVSLYDMFNVRKEIDREAVARLVKLAG